MITDMDDRFARAVDLHVHQMLDRLMAAIREALIEETGWEFPHPTTLLPSTPNWHPSPVDATPASLVDPTNRALTPDHRSTHVNSLTHILGE